VSIGLTEMDLNFTDYSQWLSKADHNMYDNKNNKSN
jgi:hypothetical protein